MTECDFCPAPAVFIVRAQWSYFDFDERAACRDHTHGAIMSFARKWVDDEPIRELLVDLLIPDNSDTYAARVGR